MSATLLVLAGSIAVASAAAIAAYFGLFRALRFGSSKRPSTVDTQISQAIQDTAVPQRHMPEQTTVEETSPTSTAPIQEAPPPFPEDSLAPISPSLPTDVSAISAISSVAASASPVVIIATPKRRARSSTKKPLGTSSTAVPRKRRSPKQPNISETTIPAPVPSVTIESEASAVTASSPQQEA